MNRPTKSPNRRQAITQGQELSSQDPTSRRISGRWQIILSVLLVIHIFAIAAEPMRLFSQNSAGLSAPETTFVRQVLSPYIDFAYLHHGYFFFAPNPGPSHLIQVRLSQTSNAGENQEPTSTARLLTSPQNLRNPVDGADRWLMIPDRSLHKPRLFYHRHFMLAEFLNNSFVPPLEPPSSPDPAFEQYLSRRQGYQSIRESIISHLKGKYNADSVDIRRVSHELPNAVQVFEERWPLNDPRLYIIMPETLNSEADVETRQ